MRRLLPFLALLGYFAFPHLAHAQSQYQTCAFSDPTHCYGIGPGMTGQAYVSNGQAYPSFSSSIPGVTSIGGVTIPATGSIFVTSPTTTTPSLCLLSTTTAGLGSWNTCGSGSMTWPSSAGIPNYTGSSSWGTSYSASNLIPDSYVGGLAGSPTSGEFWGYNGTAQGWYTPTGSGTVNSGTSTDIAYYAATGTAVSGATALTWNSSTSALTMGALDLTANGASATSIESANSIAIGAGSGGALTSPCTGYHICFQLDASSDLNITGDESPFLTIASTGQSGSGAPMGIDFSDTNDNGWYIGETAAPTLSPSTTCKIANVTVPLVPAGTSGDSICGVIDTDGMDYGVLTDNNGHQTTLVWGPTTLIAAVSASSSASTSTPFLSASGGTGGTATVVLGDSTESGSETSIQGGSGVIVGAPTGGYKGSGTLNMAGCYVNGVACGTASVTLQTNGTNNSSQTALNIENGQGIACSNPSSGNVQCATSAPERTVTSSPTVESTDMGGQIIANVSGGGTLTIPAISSSIFASGMTLSVVNYSASTMAVSTTPTVNSGGGCSTSVGIPSGASWQLLSNGTSIDCIQTVNGGGFLNSASSGTSVTPVCNPTQRLTVTTVTATGNLTINAPTGCTEGQQVTLKITYTASITYTWNAAYHANSANPGAIPTSSGDSAGVDFYTFYTDTANSRFDYLADAPAF